MNLNTYLHYNNVALIDPTLPFHASCIEQYAKKGYLTTKQIESLRNWVHPVEAIIRLMPKIPTLNVYNYTMMTPFDEPIVEEPAILSNRFTDAEVTLILNCIDTLGSITELQAAMPNRTTGTIRATLNRFGAVTRKGRVVAVDKDKYNSYCAKRGIEQA